MNEDAHYLFREALKLKDKFKGLNQEQLKNSNEYRTYLQIESQIKKYIFEGEEIFQIIEELNKEYVSENKRLYSELIKTETKKETIIKGIRDIFQGREGDLVKKVMEIIE